jgi:hypothetical protein
MTVTVLNNQTLLDIAIQATGKAENFLKIAMYNNLVPTYALVPGTVLTIPDGILKDEDILRYYNANGIVPATGITEELTTIELTCEEDLYQCFK